MKRGFKKLTTTDVILATSALRRAGWPQSRWLFFAEKMLDRGYKVSYREALSTRSKYVKVYKKEKCFTVRFSDHKPNFNREMRGDCDFFVGVTHTGYCNTSDAIRAAVRFLESKEESDDWTAFCRTLDEGETQSLIDDCVWVD